VHLLHSDRPEPAEHRRVLADADALTGMITVVHEAGGTVVDGVDTATQADWWRAAGTDTGLGGRFTKW
jgi:sensor c-di-GMP phosphodiesterase-like protein